MTLRFAIHSHCLVLKVKQQHLLGEVDFCCVSSFAFFTIFLAKNYNYIFELVKMSKVLSVRSGSASEDDPAERGAADRGRHWAQRQRRLEDRT